ncbi:phosphatase PAP2 family protein [Pontibacter ruber]|uniref:Phosphatase PAP2 family protein n=1 Tax=Pontibacter ruber TaxID=1343895 RepID=A0ABW5CVG4_9BACT|nr:phosphatase PAP2 family protein [Pontibacter ruber]
MKPITQRFVRLLALLSVELVLIWAVFFICIALFVLMAHEVFIQKDNSLDTALFAFARSHTSPEVTRLMRFISFFASAEYLMVVPALVVLGFSWFEHMRWYGLKVLLISLTSSVLNQVLKRAFERPRPETAMLEQSGLSFPSGHAMIGGAFYGVLIYIVWQTVRSPFWRWLYTVLLTVLILLIGYSRIYLNVHYATDVVAGYAIGILWLIASVYLMRKLEKVYLARYGRADIDPPPQEKA